MRVALFMSCILVLGQVHLGSANDLFDEDNPDYTKMDYVAMEIRSAMNFQTETIADHLGNLIEILTSTLISRDVIPEMLNSLKELATLRDRLDQVSGNLLRADKRIASLEEENRQLKRETKKLRKDGRSIVTDLEQISGQINDEKLKNSVFFDAYRNEGFEDSGNLTFTHCVINEGEAMNITSGYFTAPVAGVYSFTFHANTLKGNDGLVLLRHNGLIVAGTYDTDNFKHNTLAQSALVRLELADIVWIEVLSGGVRSNDNIYVHFTGVLLKPA